MTDSFTRADALTLGTGWSTTNWFGASSCLLAISANQAAYPAGKSGGCHQYWSADNLADTVASFTATALPPEGGEIDIGARIQNGGSSQAVLYEGAWLRHTAGPDTFYIVRRASNGNWATVATINGPDITVGDQLAFKLAGTSLSLHRKPAGSSSWTQILAATDTTISGPGRLGLELYNATGAKADDWTISPDLPGSSSPSVPLNTALPTVSGTAQVGQTLTGTVGTWSGASSFAQQWQRCSGASCNPIAQRDRPDLCAGRGRRRLHPAAPGHRQQHGRPQPARQLGPNSRRDRRRRQRPGQYGSADRDGYGPGGANADRHGRHLDAAPAATASSGSAARVRPVTRSRNATA